MMNKSRSLLLLSVLALLFAACEEGIIDNVILSQDYSEPEYSIAVSPSELSFPAEGGEEKVLLALTRSLSWTATTNDSWITLSENSGTDSPSTAIHIVVAENTSVESRTGKVTFKTRGKIATLTITQDATLPVLTANISVVTFPSDGGSQEISITSNARWTVANPSSWLSLSTDSGTGDATLTVTAAENSSTFFRHGTLTLNYGGEPVSIEFLQQATPDLNGHAYVDLGLPSGLLWATCNVGATTPEEYGDHFAWGETAKKNSYTWANYKWSDGSMQSLTKYNNRNDYGIVDNLSELLPSDDAAVVNWGGCWRMPTYAEWEELCNTDNCTWTPINNNGHCEGYKVTSTRNGNSIFLPAAGLYTESGFDRAGLSGYFWASTLFSAPDQGCGLYFDDAGHPHAFSRYQGLSVRPVGKMTLHFSLMPTSVNFPAAGSSETLSITANQPWTVTTSDAWLTLSADAGTGDATLNVAAEENTSITRRTGAVTFQTGATTYTVTISQEGATPTFSVTPELLSFTAEGGSASVTISSNQSWTATTSDAWFSISSAEGEGDATLSISAQANTSTDNRAGTVTFTAGGKTYSVTIIQDGVATYFEITPTTLAFTAKGGSKSVSVMSNQPWTVSSDALWLKLSDNSGTSDATLSVTAEENSSTSSRSSTITFAVGGKNYTISVTQDAENPMFSVTPASLSFTSSSDSKTLTVTSNQPWTAVTDVAWLSLSNDSGTGDATVTVTALANKSAGNRVGIITFSTGSTSYFINVTQTGVDTNKAYLTFEAIDNTTFTFSQNNVHYSLDGGATWTTLAVGTESPTVQAGDRISWKASDLTPSNNEGIGTFRSTGKFNVEGNIMSLLFEDDFVGKTSLSDYKNAFRKLFYECTKLVNANNLIMPATTLAEYCYYCMFDGCTHLTNAPVLPATTLVGYCYYGMFSRCTSLTTAPELPATTISIQCYYEMFQGCTNLTNAPELPAKKLAEHCYDGMFYGCKSLTTAPALPATTLANYCYASMFLSCSSLATAPSLPATTLTEGCYWSMFAGCTSLTTAPELPATTLASCCYYQMFNNCPRLNYIKCLATDISASGCTENWVLDVATSGTFVKDASMTSWTTSTNGIPSGWTVQNDLSSPFFSVTPTNLSFASSGGNQSVTVTSNQTWTASSSVSWLTLSMTSGTGDATVSVSAQANTSTDNRSGIVTFTAGGKTYTVTVTQEGVPTYFEITPTTLSFTSSGGSKSVSVMSNQPWTVSVDASWLKLSDNSGTSDATLSVTAEENTSTSSRSGTVTFKAGGNTYTVSVTQEEANPTFSVTPESLSFTASGGNQSVSVTSNQAWTASTADAWLALSGTSGTGDATLTITAQANKSAGNRTGTITFNAGGTSKTVSVTQEGVEVAKAYLTFEALENTTFTFSQNNLQYSLDGGATWTPLTAGMASPTVQAGDRIMWKAELSPNSSNGIGIFSSTGEFNAEGNTMSLLYGDNYVGQTSLNGKYSAFYRLFNNSKVVNAGNLVLPATTLADCCYFEMFSGCTSLTTAPELPATTLDYGCYYEMFWNCTSLTTAPELPATTLANQCYNRMFYGCTSLTTAPELPATTLDICCYYEMFWNCTSLTTAPELPATTLADDCYYRMFSGCTSLTMAPELPANSLANECYRLMFYGCTKLTTAPELPATTLADFCYAGMFSECTRLNYIKCLATDVSKDHCTTDWVKGVASSGIFVKNASMTGWTTGDSGTPSGWTVEDFPEGGNTEEHEYVDLGLPSGTLWATCNVGASSPEEYGDYFAWGETETKSLYVESTYKWYCVKGSMTNWVTKYNSYSYYGEVDDKNVLDPEDDAAFVNWGGNWRMPTIEDFQELINNCTWAYYTAQSGHNLCKVTSISNGNSILLPAAGYSYEGMVESWGCYWSKSMPAGPHSAKSLSIDWDRRKKSIGDGSRINGYSIRPVCKL